MEITELKQKGKSETYYVFLDGEKAGELQLETIYKAHLKVGVKIEQEDFIALKKENDKLTCFSVALKYISSRLKTEKQMKEYLLGKGYDYEAVKLALLKLKDYGYLNDDHYAKTFTEITSATKGKHFIKQELLRRGINKEKTEEILQGLDESTACRNAYEKWIKNKPLPLDNKNKEKLYRYLISRGFSYDTIKSTVNDFFEY